ncbi:MAG: hypothetical protein IKI50_01865 [Clostridia bacterium]|nr:hypothetical protein [Clostridia bacterium]
MKRIIALLLTAALLAAVGSGCTPDPSESGEKGNDPMKNTLDTVGYFVFRSVSEKQLDFYKAAGYNLLEYCDLSWFYNPDSDAYALYQQEQAANIRLAKQKGFKVYVILLSTLEQWTGPADSGNGGGKAFDPADSEKMATRLGYIRQVVGAFKEADGFSLFAGDPGGVLGIKAEGGLQYYIQMSRDVRQIVKEVAPHAEFNMNLWAVSQFIQEEVDPSTLAFWQGEDRNGRTIIAEDDLLSADIGIEITGSDYYRPLAMQLYAAYDARPATNFPNENDVKAIQAKGTTRYWGFGHGLAPDCQDNLRLNTTRIKYYVDQMRAAGMNGAVCGNVSYFGNYLDVYAFARFASDPTLTVDQLFLEYAALLTETESDAATLAELLKYLNNMDAHNQNLPAEYDLPRLETIFTDTRTASQKAYRLTPNTETDFPFPEEPMYYLARVQGRLFAAIRPENAEPAAAMLWDFDKAGAQKAPDGTAGIAQLTMLAGGSYTLIEQKIQPAVDAGNYGRYGYLHLSVYSEKEQTVRGYIMLGSDASKFGIDQFWYYDFSGALHLHEGWNHLAIETVFGGDNGTNGINWGHLEQFRVLFFCEKQEGHKLWLDNLYISNYEEHKLP